MWKLIKSGKKKNGNKRKKIICQSCEKKIHVKIQPLLAVAYHEAIIQNGVKIFLKEHFYQGM